MGLRCEDELAAGRKTDCLTQADKHTNKQTGKDTDWGHTRNIGEGKNSRNTRNEVEALSNHDNLTAGSKQTDSAELLLKHMYGKVTLTPIIGV